MMDTNKGATTGFAIADPVDEIETTIRCKIVETFINSLALIFFKT